MSVAEISPLQFAQIRVSAEVLARSFDDSPILRHLIPRDRARTVVMRAFFIAGLADAHKHGEAWVATVDGTIVGAAVWLPPGSYPPGWSRQARQLLHLVAVAPIAFGSLSVRSAISVRWSRFTRRPSTGTSRPSASIPITKGGIRNPAARRGASAHR